MAQAIKALDSGDQSINLMDEFRLLAENGFHEADFFLGCMYEDGTNGLSRDIPLALLHYEKAANEIGYLEAYLAQARLLYNGYGGIEKDLDKAKSIYELVKDYNQNPIACFMHGRMYQYGEGVNKNFDEAEKLYKIVIEKGNVWGMLNLAKLYAEKKMYFSNLKLRVRAGIKTILISRKNPRDARLRGG